MKTLGKYSIGIGDRFGHQGRAQLQAVQRAQDDGIAITPVWNKSHREHRLIGTTPQDTRRAADAAIRASGWDRPYFVDADHIGLSNVSDFLPSCDFFTIDVADAVGITPNTQALDDFGVRCQAFMGLLDISGLDTPLTVTLSLVREVGRRYLHAAQEAGRVYRLIADSKGAGTFIIEVSLDEVTRPQSPVELLLILAMLAWEGVPVQTIAPKFTGDFFKGIDYVGNPEQFAREFADDMAVVQWAIQACDLPADLKISIHSGSDKVSLYPRIYQIARQFDAGVHLKTAGTTWLEELIGLALAGGDGLAIVKDIYTQAYSRRGELCAPYATVTAIDSSQLPDPVAVAEWSNEAFVEAVRHDQGCAAYNPHLRQLLHVAFRVAAEMGGNYREALERHAGVIAEQVTINLYDRHIAPLFLGRCPSEVR